MNIAVIGATGSTGLEFVRQALEKGHNITALVRTPARMTVQHENLHMVQGDVYNAEDVARVVAGQDAIFISLGTGANAIKTTIREDGTRIVLDVLQESGETPFLLVMSSLGVNESMKQVYLFWPVILNPLLGNAFKDHAEQEKLVRASGLPHLILRPTNLSDAPGMGSITASPPPKHAPVLPSVARADVVAYALDALENQHTAPEAIALTKAR
ncbi:MAG: NAD(P)H-binding protein [Anaerolineae bacterium]|nr:NAD(P)H-binding protein [Anaerolineae bacterium]